MIMNEEERLAFGEGVNAYFAHRRASPYPIGSRVHKAWEAGWCRGRDMEDEYEESYGKYGEY